MPGPCIVWIRNDLRLHDNPALLAASKTGKPIIVCFIWSEEDQEPYPLGGASRAWLHDSLIEFNQSVNGKLILRKGRYLPVLLDLIRESDAKKVFWNRCYEPHLIERDKQILSHLTEGGIDVETFAGNLLFEPWEVLTKTQKPFRVFTPFYKSLLKRETTPSRIAPVSLVHYPGHLASETMSALSLLTRNPPLDIWQPGEKGALKALEHFVNGADGTSKLAAHLHFGELSVRRVAEAIAGQDAEGFYRQLMWREFAAHTLYHFSQMPASPLKEEFSRFPWRKDPEQLASWHDGLTGYPIVDAGMRELLATGWMHNRVRMIVGSFLVKHLLLSWTQGSAWFWEKLFDADLANNSFGWQWVAGCGADAAPYFRFFNPVVQGKDFDPEGVYIRRWVTELKGVDAQFIHTPWLTQVEGYPHPIVDLDFGRMRALEAFQEMKNHRL